MLCVSTAPSDGPASVTASTVTANSITLQWKEVPCLHRNGEITGYRVVARTSGEDDLFVDVDVDDGREATVSGLHPSTTYSVAVAAVNSAATGPFRGISVKTAGECNSPYCGIIITITTSSHQMDYLHLPHHPPTL